MGFLIVIGVIVLVAVILLVFGLSRQPTGQALVEERLGNQTAAVSDTIAEEQDGPGFVSAVVDRAVAGRGFAANLSTQLARANLKWTVGEFLVRARADWSVVHQLVAQDRLLETGYGGHRFYLRRLNRHSGD